MIALVGKVGARLSELLTDEDFEDLLSSSSVPEIAQKLRKTAYGQYIPQIEDIHRRDLEAALQRRLYGEVDSFKKFTTYPQKKVLKHMLLRCEIDTVKKLLRIVRAGEDASERFFVCKPPVDVTKIQDIPSFVNALSGRPYHSLLSSVLKSTGYETVGRLENALDYWYLTKMMTLLRKAGARKAVVFLKKQFDLMNAMWIYRARVMLGYEREAVLNLLLPEGYHLKKPLLEELASVKSSEEFFTKISRTPYSEVFEKIERTMTDFLMERTMERYMMKMAKDLVRSSGGFLKVLGYVHLLEFEIKDLITVIEAVRYKLGVDVAKEYLIGHKV